MTQHAPSRRDWFIGQALAGLTQPAFATSFQRIAADACAIADATIEASDRPPQQIDAVGAELREALRLLHRHIFGPDPGVPREAIDQQCRAVLARADAAVVVLDAPTAELLAVSKAMVESNATGDRAIFRRFVQAIAAVEARAQAAPGGAA